MCDVACKHSGRSRNAWTKSRDDMGPWCTSTDAKQSHGQRAASYLCVFHVQVRRVGTYECIMTTSTTTQQGKPQMYKVKTKQVVPVFSVIDLRHGLASTTCNYTVISRGVKLSTDKTCLSEHRLVRLERWHVRAHTVQLLAAFKCDA